MLRKAGQDIIERTDMRILRRMMGIKTIEKIKNEEIRATAGGANISAKIIDRVTEMVRTCAHIKGGGKDTNEEEEDGLMKAGNDKNEKKN